MQLSVLLVLILINSNVRGQSNSTTDENPCTLRTSSDHEDRYVVECTVRDQTSMSRLATWIKSTQIHGDDDRVAALNPAWVEELRLNGPIEELRPNAFSFLPDLRRLVIDSRAPSDDQPRKIQTHEATFGGLVNLTSLHLIARFTPESIVADEVLPDSLRALGLTLEVLTIERADLRGTLSEKVTKNFPKLKELTIVDSPNLTLSNESRLFSDKLERLELTRVSVLSLPKSISSAKALRFLRLDNVSLSSLPADSFANFAPTMIELRIERNPLTNLDPIVFRNMKSLKILSLSGSQLSKLPDGIFHDLIKMDELSLSENRLETIPDRIFANTNRLVKLDLSKNRLIKIDTGSLTRLERSLTHLDLSENRIRAFHAVNLSAELGVSLASNEIDALDGSFFAGGQQTFNRLLLGSNPLRQMKPGAFAGVFVGSGNLYLQGANFARLDLAIFDGMKSAAAGGEDEGDQTQIVVSNCPSLVGLNTTMVSSKIRWPNGIKQIVFSNNPRFVLSDEPSTDDAYFPELAKFVHKTGVQFVFEGPVLCVCRWNWLRSGKFAKKDERDEIVDFGSAEESTPATCCNLRGVAVEDFLDKGVFEEYCNGTRAVKKEVAIEVCPNFDPTLIEDPEARKRRRRRAASADHS